MSKLEELINTLCPNGVKYRFMGELGDFYGGLSGKTRNDFENGNAKFITYKNIYSNIALKIDVEDTVKINKGETKNTIQYGDVLFTGSSETPDECGFSSVLTTHTEEKLYLNSFCFGYRLYDLSLFLPDFMKYLFRSNRLRTEIGKTANGVTRFNVSKKKMGKIKIPVPPIAVQREIVRILDNFTKLTAELTAELTARKKQYEYYRDELLNVGERIRNVEYKKLGEVCAFQNGFAFKSNLFKNNGLPIIRITNVQSNGIVTNNLVYFEKKDYKENLERYILNMGDIVIAMSGATTGKIAVNNTNRQYFINQRVGKFIPNEKVLNKRFLYHYLLTQLNLFYTLAGGGAQPNLSSEKLKQIMLPIPPLEEQERIVAILDRFDKLCNDISQGLPAEIEARKKQYEYYRDKLLTFKELSPSVAERPE